MTSRHPAVSCACPKCQSERRTPPPPTPATDAREAVARAICLAHGAFPERRILAFYAHADAALSALAPIRAAEILAAEAEALGYATRLAVSLHATHFAVTAPEWQPLPDLIGVLTQIDNITTGIAEAAEANERARIVAWLRDCKGGCGIDAIEAMGDAADQIERNEHGAGK